MSTATNVQTANKEVVQMIAEDVVLKVAIPNSAATKHVTTNAKPTTAGRPAEEIVKNVL